MDDIQQCELRFFAQRYDKNKSTLRNICEIMNDVNPDAPIRDILLAFQRVEPSTVSITPKSVIEFVRTLIDKTACERLYIPFATGIEVDEFKSSISQIDYCAVNLDLRDLISKKTGVKCVSQEEIENTKYNMIYSDLPFGSLYRGSIQRTIIEESMGHLSPEGIGVFTFANNIVFSSPAKNWIATLKTKGVYISAIIDLPEGAYEPMTSIPSKLIVFSQRRNDKVFIAKTRDEKDAVLIAEFYLAEKNSPKSDMLGKWIERDLFPDFTTYENEQRRLRTIAKIEKSYNGKMHRISEISTAVCAPKRSEEPFVDSERAVYIPKLGKSDVVTNLDKLIIKPQNYFQVLVDQEKILPEFLKFYLNTDSGVTARVRASFGTIPALNVERIKGIEIPVPPIKTQIAVLNVYSELTQIELEVSRLKGRLEEVPASHKNISKEIKDINNKGDKFEQWIESLPYPLATILKRYTAADNDPQRQEMLFFFFEAYSIFAAAILIAVYQQPQFNSSRIEDVEAKYFEKAAFGAWVRMDRALAKEFRLWMDSPTKIDIILSGFHTDDQTLVKLLCQGEVYSILQRTCDFRNSWKGHSGITSEMLYSDHVRVLREELAKLQERLSDLYDKLRLIRPVSLRYEDGMFINNVEILTGSNSIFKKDEIVGEALDSKKLYIQIIDTQRIIEVPPLFVLKNSPADVKNACYFYNRIEGKGSRYVSYHFESQHDDVEEGEVAFDTIKAILERTNN